MLEGQAQNPAGIVVKVAVDADRAVVTIEGEIDLGTVDQVEGCFEDLLCRSCTQLTVDTTGVTFIDSRGLQAFMQVANKLGPAHFLLKNPSSKVRKLIALTGLEEMLRMDPPQTP